MPGLPVDSPFWRFGAFSGAAGVMLGAFGAHALQNIVDPKMLTVWETSNRYHIFHSLAMLFVPLTITSRDQAKYSKSGWLFGIGILLFSGSLYTLVLTGNKKLGAITPIGGLCLIGGWVALAFGV
ncbi:hypothetical protein AAMO2058_000243400 [Amorphochlora amoebiformis]